MTETGPKPKHSKNGRKNYLNWSGPKAMKKEKEKKKVNYHVTYLLQHFKNKIVL